MDTLGYNGSMNSGIYQITNQVNGKRYIGSSANPQRRWQDHLRKLRRGRHCNPHLQAAFGKYGEDAFEFSVLEELESVNLILREQYYLDAFAPEYNIALIAGSPMLGRYHTPEARVKMSGERNHNYGQRPTDETRVKISAAKMGHPTSAEARRKMSAAHKGKRQSDETRAKLSAAHKGKHLTAQTRARIRAARMGKHPSDETRARMSKAHMGRVASDKTRAKMSAAHMGHLVSEETRRKLSEAHRGERSHMYGKHLSEETKRKLSEAHKGKHHSAETRAKISAARKAYWRKVRALSD